MSKECLTTIRLTGTQRAFVDKEAEHQGVSVAETIRRIIDDYRAPDKIMVPLEGAERAFVDDLAEALGETPGKTVRLSLITYRAIMEAPLATILKPLEEVIEELAERD
ncbi:unnamed protein product [marine sediment metagenome]|uniref:Uncharacterized protein n=1 Tax=marine sediment metagenome TaxID=412755 RepID=X1UP11_9ZZZZ